MAKPKHTKRINITRRTDQRRSALLDKDAERFRLQRDIDQRHADLALQRELREWV